MDDDCMMTTYIDDGLIEDCLDDPASIIDLDELDFEDSVIDLDAINNITIEDPGCILEESLDSYKQPEQKRRTYGKESFTLPVTFFDNSRNIRLLTKCRPIVIKIVDCEMYPWYYKRIKPEDKGISVTIKHKEPNEEIVCIDTEEVKEIETEEVIEITIPSTPSYVSKINVTAEQSLGVLKLKKDIEKQTCVDIGRKESNNIKEAKLSHPGIIVTEDKIENNVEKIDLLAYEAIAQSIVRKIDEGEANSKKVDSINVQEPDLDKRNVKETCATPDKRDTGTSKTREKIITSPILPCKTSQQKKTRQPRATKKLSIENPNIINNKELNNNCGNISSSNRVIPHFHYCMPMLPPTTPDHFYNMDPRRISQYYAAKNYLDQSQMINQLPQQQYYNNNNLQGINNQNLVNNPQYRVTTPVKKIVGHPTTCYGPSLVSNLQQTQFSNEDCNIRQRNIKNKQSIQVTNKSRSQNDCWTTFFNFIGYQAETGRKPHHARVSNVSTENYRVLSQQCPSIYNSSFKVNSVPVNPELNAANLSLPMASKVHAHPLLTQLLNESYAPSHFAAQQNTAIKNVPSSMPSNLLMTDSRALNDRLSLQYEDKGGQRILSLKKSTGNRVNQFIERNDKKCTQVNNMSGEASESRNIGDNNLNFTTAMNEKNNDGLDYTTRLNACGHLIRENFTELHKLKSNLVDYKKLDTKSNNIYPLIVPATDKYDSDYKNSCKEPPKTSGYSPAILPIPTFTKSLEMLSKFQQNKYPNKINKGQVISKKNTNNLVTPEKNNSIDVETEISRKRKNSEPETKTGKVKKISLQAYKKRILESMEKDVKASEEKQGNFDGRTKQVKQNVDTLDLGYDSDSTVILEAN